MQEARSIKSRFSRAAASYDSFTDVQRLVAAAVADRFKKIQPVRRVLEVGCGSGLLTEKACAGLKNSGTAFVALDVSKEMLDRTRRKLHAGYPTQWIRADFLAYKPKARFDCIVSSSALHWIMPLDKAIGQCRRLLLSRGHLVFGMMIAGTLAELHSARQRIAPRKPVKDSLPKRAEVMKLLARHRFAIRTCRAATYREEFASAEAFFKTLHDRGVTGGGVSHGHRFLNRREIQELTEWYNRHNSTDSGGVFATYKVLFVHAVRGEP